MLAEKERTERAAISIGSAAVVQELEESYAPRTSLQVSGQLYNLKELGEIWGYSPVGKIFQVYM